VKNNFSKIFYIYLLLVKLINEKYFLVKEKFILVSRKIYIFFILGEKHFLEIVKKYRNIVLFADYNKFDPQTFDCYIFCFESFFFQSHLLEFDLI
jgi:hypothetical protein